MLADHVEENVPVLPKLRVADAMHRGHLHGGSGLAPRHVDERLVGEDDIGGDPLLLGQFGAPAPQRLKQRGVAGGPVGERRGRSPAGPLCVRA
jgi:hypothetical protein